MAEIRNLGVTGALVTFADAPSAEASQQALAFRTVVDRAALPGVTETAPTLTSLYVGFDPLVTDFPTIAEALGALAEAPWAEVPTGRRLWKVPALFDGPDLAQVAEVAGLSPAQTVEQITAEPLTILMLGFAPGQPYLGLLPKALTLPRQTALQDVPAGAVVTAVGQVTMFDRPSPTGWRWIARMAFQMFRPELEPSIALAPGDQVRFEPVAPEVFADLSAAENGGARCQDL